MKKMLALLLTLCLLAGTVPLGAGAEEGDVAQVEGGSTYSTLADAVQAVINSENKTGTVKLLQSTSGSGIGLFEKKGATGVDLTIDFGGYTYTCKDPAVGSTGTESQGFHLEKGNTVTLKNGAIDVADDSQNTQMLIQNYCDLKLENLSLHGASVTQYIISSNYGDMTLSNVNISGENTGLVGIDLMHWLGTTYKDKAPTIKINNTSVNTIFGDIDVYCYGTGSDSCEQKPSLSISGGTFSSDVSQYTAEDYTAVKNEDGQYVVEKLDANNAVAMAGEKYFKSLSDAFSEAQEDATIYLLQDTRHNERINVKKNATLNLGGHTLISETSHSFVVSPKVDFMIQNGTIQNKTGTVAYALKGSIITLDRDATLECKDGICGTNNVENEGGAKFNIYGKIHSTDIAVWIQGIGNTVNIEGAELKANYFTVYQNGSYGGNTYTIKNSTIYNGKDGGAAIYISNSKKNSENAGQGFQTLTVENSKITGETGIEVKYTHVTIKGKDTEVIATGTPPETTLNNNGSVTTGYAFASTHNGTNSSEDGAGGTITIKGGAFNGLIGLQQPTGEAATTASFSISGGYFTSDPSEYCAKNLTGVANTDSNSSTYPFTVGESNVEVETAVAAGEPSVKVPTDIISGVTADTVKEAAQAEATQTSLQNAATLAGLSNDPSVVGTEEAAKDELSAAGVTIGGETVTVVVQPYLDVKVKSAETTEDTKSMTVDISAKYNVIATTADDPEDIELESTKPGTSKNAVILKPNQDMKVTSPVTITLPLPNGFVTSAADKVYVQHKGYEYEATVTETEEEPNKTYTATFTNPHGFSTFVLSTDSKTVATVNGTDYTNFQQAIKDAGSSNTITVKQGDLSANGVTHDLKLENGTGDEITVTINGEKITIPAGGTETFTYTAPTPPRPTEEKHSITISTDGKGQVTGPASAAEDDKVTLTVKPGADKELYDLKVTDEDGKAIAVTKVNDATYTFTMPDGKVTIAATFGCDGGDNCPSKAFTDLGDKQWYHDSIDYAVENGLLEGTSPTTMEPNATLIRAQLAQILYNIEDKPAVTGEMVFEDVPASEWFYSPVLWANQNEIINGTSPTTFEPLEDISRQDLALMLYRYAGKPAVTGDLDGFTDAEQVGDWAEEAMAWAVDEGIVQGDTPTTLNPTGTATRAEAAAMLQRFLGNAA